MTGPLLLCFDGSEESVAAIRAAGALLPGHEALVLTVAVPAADQFALDPVGDLVGRLSRVYSDLDEIGAELADRQARHGCEIAGEAGLHVRPLTAVGPPVPTILKLADDHDVAAIVLGAGRRGRMDELLGSVSGRVVHRASRPVLVIPSGG